MQQKEYQLLLAAKKNQDDVVITLIETGTNIHAYSDCAIRFASANGNTKLVKYLIDNGADIHADHNRALKWAAEGGHLDTVKLLVENGADVTTCGKLRMYNEQVIKYLVECGTVIQPRITVYEPGYDHEYF